MSGTPKSQRTAWMVAGFWGAIFILVALGRPIPTEFLWFTGGMACLAAGKWALDRLIIFRWGTSVTLPGDSAPTRPAGP